jgi:hypothetical protein
MFWFTNSDSNSFPLQPVHSVYSLLFNSQDAGELSFVESELVFEDLANNWGWIMAGGVLNVIAGSRLLAYSVLGMVLSEILLGRCLCCSKSIKPLWHGKRGIRHSHTYSDFPNFPLPM